MTGFDGSVLAVSKWIQLNTELGPHFPLSRSPPQATVNRTPLESAGQIPSPSGGGGEVRRRLL
jgi:hypothetical protein